MLKTLNGININILKGGYDNSTPKHPTIILIHGAGMNATVWQMQTRYLANRGINILAIDLPGHGYSEGEGYDSIQDMSKWIKSLINELKLSEVILAGHSMGSLISIEAAYNNPEDIKGLILLGTSSSMPVHPNLIDAAKTDLLSAAEMITDWSYGKKQHLGGHPLPGYWMIDSSVNLITESKPDILAKDLIACNNYKDIIDKAKTLIQDVLIISGNEDKMTPAKKARELNENIQNSKIKILNGCGHMMMIEKPREVTNLIYNYIKEL